MADPFAFLTGRLDKLKARGRLRRLVQRTCHGLTLVEADGRTLSNFGSNDYLGIASAHTAATTHRAGAGASPLVCGWTAAHERLKETLASFEQTASAVVFPTGFAACSGTVATLSGEEDLLLSDALNHASLIDGCRLSRATRVIYPHGDADFVRQILREQRSRFQRVWIVTDSVFSMDGDIAPLEPLADIAERHDAHLLVDEAHATGTLGSGGSGACEALGLKKRVSVRLGTLSKAVGSQGGFVVGPSAVCDYLVNCCRTLIYSTSLSPAAVAAAQAGIETICDRPDLRAKLHHLCRTFRDTAGCPAASPLEEQVPIVSIPIGQDADAVEVSHRLAERGFFVPAIRPPTVPEGSARLRVSLSAGHDESTVCELAAAIRELT